MRKLALALCVAAIVASANAAEVAVTDFYNNGLVGGGQYLDMIADPQSTVAAGITSADWTTGTDLTAAGGTPASHCIWADGWDNEHADDYIKLTLQLDAGYYLDLDQLIFMTRASSTGPTTAYIDVLFDGSSAWTTSYATSTSYNNKLLDVGVSSDYGDLVEVVWTATGATGSTGSWRVGNYYDGGYFDSGILGDVVPEPASLLLLGFAGLLIRRR
jgi:hypothetical protein